MQHSLSAVRGAALFLALTVLPVSAAAQEEDPDLAKFMALTEADTMILVPMRDGVGLATDVGAADRWRRSGGRGEPARHASSHRPAGGRLLPFRAF